jgi:hypothetical protein
MKVWCGLGWTPHLVRTKNAQACRRIRRIHCERLGDWLGSVGGERTYGVDEPEHDDPLEYPALELSAGAVEAAHDLVMDKQPTDVSVSAVIDEREMVSPTSLFILKHRTDSASMSALVASSCGTALILSLNAPRRACSSAQSVSTQVYGMVYSWDTDHLALGLERERVETLLVRHVEALLDHLADHLPAREQRDVHVVAVRHQQRRVLSFSARSSATRCLHLHCQWRPTFFSSSFRWL